MAVLGELAAALRSGSVEVVDLTAPLTETTPILQLPEPFAQHEPLPAGGDQPLRRARPGLVLERHPHRRAHRHPPRRPGALGHRPGRRDVSQVAPGRLIAPAAVLDKRRRADPDFLLEIDDVKAWEAEHGPLPDGGWLLYRTGWDARADDQEEFLNADDTGPHTPGISVECARWLAEESPIIGLGVETVGTDAGAAHSFDPPFPCHSFLLGAGKYGLTQLRNLQLLPPTGALLVTAPLPIVGGSGSPTRVLALVER